MKPEIGWSNRRAAPLNVAGRFDPQESWPEA